MSATLHIYNARIWTGRSERPSAESLTIIDGSIEALDESRPEADILINAAGRTVIPGFIDAHVHMVIAGQSLAMLDLSQVRSREQFETAIAQRHVELPKDNWLLASGWSQENWPGGEMPDKTWLSAAGDRPVVCCRVDLHASLVNDAVLRLCDLALDPAGGRIVRDSKAGDPTGLMLEAAAWNIVKPAVPSPSAAEKQQALLDAQAHVHSMGITTVGTMEYSRDLDNVYLPLRDRLTLRCRITLLDRDWPMSFDYGRAFQNDDQLAVIGYKSFLDGTFGSRTARMLADYADDRGTRGMLIEFAAEGRLLRWAQAVVDNGFSPSMHAIGDEAVRVALNVVEALEDRPGARARIEHAQQVDPADLHRFKDRIVSMQPLHKADDGRYALDRVGDQRLAGTFPFRDLLDSGAQLAFGSDWPVVSCSPIAGMRAAITGRLNDDSVFRPDQNLTVDEALRAYTSGAASALAFDSAGDIRPGAAGDIVILDSDPFTADWLRQPPCVDSTIVGGRIVYSRRS